MYRFSIRIACWLWIGFSGGLFIVIGSSRWLDSPRLSFVNQDPNSLHLFIVDTRTQVPADITGELSQVFEYDWSPDGQTLLVLGAIGRESGLYRMDWRSGKAQILLPVLRERGINTPRWSPDGTQIVYSAAEISGNNDIYVIDGAGGEPTRLMTDGAAFHYGASWSPDGTQIAYVASFGRMVDVMTVRADGSQPAFIIELPAGVGIPAWSPDSTVLAYTYDDNYVHHLSQLHLVQLAGGELLIHERFENNLLPATWSADGRYIAYVPGGRGLIQLYMPAEDKFIRLPMNPRRDFQGVVWSAAGATFAALYKDDTQPGIYILDMNSGESRTVPLPTNLLPNQLAWQP